MPFANTSLDLTLDEAAAAYVRDHGGVLTIRTRPQHGCCGGRVDRATVSTTPPDDPDAYVRTERDGLTAYVHRGLVALGDAPIHVGLDRFWIWSALYVEAASTM
jgi:hypothetical protein